MKEIAKKKLKRKQAQQPNQPQRTQNELWTSSRRAQNELWPSNRWAKNELKMSFGRPTNEPKLSFGRQTDEPKMSPRWAENELNMSVWDSFWAYFIWSSVWAHFWLIGLKAKAHFELIVSLSVRRPIILSSFLARRFDGQSCLAPRQVGRKRGVLARFLRGGVSGCCVGWAAHLGQDFGAKYGLAANLALAFGKILGQAEGLAPPFSPFSSWAMTVAQLRKKFWWGAAKNEALLGKETGIK